MVTKRGVAMVQVEVIAVYVAVAGAILGGLLLLWCLLEELLEFDPRAHRSRSAKVPGVDVHVGLVVAKVSRSARDDARVSEAHPVGGAAR